MSPTDVDARFAIGFSSDAAGIDDHHIGFADSILGGAVRAQESRYGFAIGAGGAATKVFDVEGRGHRVSLAEFCLRLARAGEVRGLPPSPR